MTHLLAQPMVVDATIVVPLLEGVTTAIVLFIFACVLFPTLVKNKTQFYAAFVAVLLVIVLHSLGLMIRTAGFQVFAGAATGLLQVAAIVLLFTSAGGLSVKQLAGEMSRAYEVLRRGEDEKEVIIPITGEMPRPRQQPPAPSSPRSDEPPSQTIDLPSTGGWPTKPQQKQNEGGGIPLE